jgi:hypothetical protein
MPKTDSLENLHADPTTLATIAYNDPKNQMDDAMETPMPLIKPYSEEGNGIHNIIIDKKRVNFTN